MKGQDYTFGIIVILLIVSAIVVASYAILTSNQISTPSYVTSFEDCVNSGQQIIAGTPRTCRSKSGTVYIEKLAVPEPLPLPPPAAPATTSEETPLQQATSTPEKDMMRVTSPSAKAKVSSPLTIEGEARGNWYFEASFPISLVDASGTVVASGIGKAQGDWMTTEYVPFTATLTWTKAVATSGILILKRDNPSGLKENDASVAIPVRF